MLRTAVIGVGSLGKQHARIHADLAAEGLSDFVAVCDLNEETARSVGSERKTDWITGWRELIGRIDAASIAVPTEAHCDDSPVGRRRYMSGGAPQTARVKAR